MNRDKTEIDREASSALKSALNLANGFGKTRIPLRQSHVCFHRVRTLARENGMYLNAMHRRGNENEWGDLAGSLAADVAWAAFRSHFITSRPAPGWSVRDNARVQMRAIPDAVATMSSRRR